MRYTELTQDKLTAIVKGVLAFQNFDFAERVRDDIDHARKLKADQQTAFFENRVFMTRVFQGLNELVKDFYRQEKFDKHMEIYLEARGFSYAEIHAIDLLPVLWTGS